MSTAVSRRHRPSLSHFFIYWRSAPHVAWEVLWVFLWASVGTRVFNCSIKQKCGPERLCRIAGVIVIPAGKIELKMALTLFKGFSNCNCKGIWSEREGALNECKRQNERLRQRTRAQSKKMNRKKTECFIGFSNISSKI